MSVGTAEPIHATTRCCAVFGHPIRHSASPAMHNAALAAQGLDCRYLAFDVHPDQLREALAGAKVMKYVGVNLTLPHKVLALDMMDVLDDSARKWGAVNTVRFEAPDAEGHWHPLLRFRDGVPQQIRSHGFNTDADGLVRSLEEDLGITSRGKRILLLGAGGAGRAAALRLADEGAGELFLVNRTGAKAEALAGEIRKSWPEVRVRIGYPGSGVDLLLNSTSLGLRADDPLPLDAKLLDLREVKSVYDMIYQPAETPLLAAAKSAGCRVANGLGMLLHQGALANEIWTGLSAPLDIMRRALREAIYGV